jgi:hypothetical protein
MVWSWQLTVDDSLKPLLDLKRMCTTRHHPTMREERRDEAPEKSIDIFIHFLNGGFSDDSQCTAVGCCKALYHRYKARCHRPVTD